MEFKIDKRDGNSHGDFIIDDKVVIGSDCSSSLRLVCEENRSWSSREEVVIAAKALGCIVRDVRYTTAYCADCWWRTPRKLVFQRGNHILIIRKNGVSQKLLPEGSRVMTEHTSKLLRGESVLYYF
jgi:hypothetical protein